MAGLVVHVLVLSAFGLYATVVANVEKDELVATALLFRHGDRSPLKSFPNDEYIDKKYWPNGLGQLLNTGKYRAYQLGKYLRRRYNTFLSDQYKREEIHVISSDIDRAMMTAESMLAGLYPPTKEDIWFKDLLWAPIPVHSIPFENDNFIGMKANCPKFGTLYNNITQMDVFQQLKKRYSDIFDTVSAKSGWSNLEIESIKSLVGTMYVYSKYNTSYIPEWYTRLDQRSLNYLAGVGFAIPTYTKEIQRFRSGPFFNYLINYLDDAIKGEKPKFLVISGHDTTIASILSTIDCYNYEPPEFTATVIWEVYRTNDGKHYINLLYKKNSESEAKPIVVDNCKSNVTYDNFKAAVSPILTNDEQWRHDCFATVTTAGTGRIGSSFLTMSVILFLSKYF